MPFVNAAGFVTVSTPGITLATNPMAPEITLPATPTTLFWQVTVMLEVPAGIRKDPLG
jgi:hypothetical protein